MLVGEKAHNFKRVLLICDEVYLIIDTNVPQRLVFVRNVEKRVKNKKYELL